jgi:hypothetical protein
MNWLSELARRLNKLLHRRRHYRHSINDSPAVSSQCLQSFCFRRGRRCAASHSRSSRVTSPRGGLPASIRWLI